MKITKVALPQIQCQLHDHAKQYDNDEACSNKRNGGKLHGNISRNGYGNVIIGRYGGCFEEGNCGCYATGESCTTQESLAMVEDESASIPWTHMKNSHTYCESFY